MAAQRFVGNFLRQRLRHINTVSVAVVACALRNRAEAIVRRFTEASEIERHRVTDARVQPFVLKIALLEHDFVRILRQRAAVSKRRLFREIVGVGVDHEELGPALIRIAQRGIFADPVHRRFCAQVSELILRRREHADLRLCAIGVLRFFGESG